MRAFERALRRTGLRLRLSEGYHPKPRMAFPAPLPVGVEGTDEVMEFELAEWAPLDDIERRLTGQLPGGIVLKGASLAAQRSSARAVGVTYRIRPTAQLAGDERLTQKALESLLGRESIPVRRIRKRKEKTVNIRPFIRDLKREGDEIVLDAAAGPEGSTRPEEIVESLGLDPVACRAEFRVLRTRVELADEEAGDRPRP